MVNSLIAENRFRPLIENLVLPPKMVPLVKQLIAEPQVEGPITPLFDEMYSTRQLAGPITPLINYPRGTLLDYKALYDSRQQTDFKILLYLSGLNRMEGILNKEQLAKVKDFLWGFGTY